MRIKGLLNDKSLALRARFKFRGYALLKTH